MTTVTIRDEPLPSLARKMVQFLQAGPATEDVLRQNFGTEYWGKGVIPLYTYAFARFPVIEQAPDYYRVGPFQLIPEHLRCRVVLRETFRAEYWGGTVDAVAGRGTVWNAWRLPTEEKALYPHASAGDCEVHFWNKYGSDSFFLSESRDFEIVPWATPLVAGIESVDRGCPISRWVVKQWAGTTEVTP